MIVGTVRKHPLMKTNIFDNIFQFSGDFNLNLLNYNKLETLLFLEIIFTNNFFPQATLPTRVAKNSVTLIDNILINQEEAKTTSITDHFPKFLIMLDPGSNK